MNSDREQFVSKRQSPWTGGEYLDEGELRYDRVFTYPQLATRRQEQTRSFFSEQRLKRKISQGGALTGGSPCESHFSRPSIGRASSATTIATDGVSLSTQLWRWAVLDFYDELILFDVFGRHGVSGNALGLHHSALWLVCRGRPWFFLPTGLACAACCAGLEQEDVSTFRSVEVSPTTITEVPPTHLLDCERRCATPRVSLVRSTRRRTSRG